MCLFKKAKVYASRFFGDMRYRMIVSAVISLILNLVYSFYYIIIGFLSSSFIFAASFAYNILLAGMRFCVVVKRKDEVETGSKLSKFVGAMLIILSTVFHITVIVSMRFGTASSYGEIVMISIATVTFVKIAVASVNAVKYKNEYSYFIRAVNVIRYSEIAVSLFAMQQSMLASFGNATDRSSIILNAFTGAGVCFFILFLGIITFKNSKKNRIQND